jgi:hypothetical protein
MNEDGSYTFIFGENESWYKFTRVLNLIKEKINIISNDDINQIFRESITQIIDIVNNNLLDFVDKIMVGPDLHYLNKGELIADHNESYELLKTAYMEFALCWQREIKAVIGTDCSEDFMVIKDIQKSLVVIVIYSGRFKDATAK